ncbi:probable leucine--tRNA ligase, mitochondrial [Aplysia californica]|uniref:leucine--tRNA ligase n=2 Tax=Aplysia californica TaxID=6500 RepID=A0ABM0ZV70_APLCA|nr:probable leucine--tRNA ligase, mitochondrial [Aplysia californica]
MKHLLKLKPSTSWCMLNHQRLLGNARTIFSKTGIWNPQLSVDTRLEIEKYWQPLIREHDRQQAELVQSTQNEDKETFYALSMFPYPSGNLHLGHVRVYTISDVMARYQRAKGKQVIHPMGWDAFGLPAENAAIERNIHPKEWTYSNIAKMKEQLHSMGFSFDWSREIATCDPSYYKWTQYIFLKMYEHGLAFQKKGLVNWDPVDMTVLADEQIDEQGCSWRSGAKVEKKYLTQWYLRDTVFSQSLLEGLDEVDPTLWRDIISVQKNWISDCTGHRIDFGIELTDGSLDFPVSIYTENLDLIHGVSHVCVSPEHYLAVDCGVTVAGAVLPVQAIHPVTKQKLKVVVTDSEHFFKNRDVMLGIPSVSDNARDVAEQLGLEFLEVLDKSRERLVNSEELTGLTREEAMKAVQQKILDLGVGGERISEQLNDWLISRQRYWGTPIPIIHCPQCKVVPVPVEQLPVELPQTGRLVSKGGKSPLEEDTEWLNVKCPKCGGPAQRETDTMDTFVDSTWYFLRYLDPRNDEQPFNPSIARKFMPVDLYVGGKEHALLHLYFARFVCHFLHSLGLLEQREPFVNLLTQGMVKGESFRVKSSGKYVPPHYVDLSGEVPVEAGTGEELITEWEKMSKSKHNGVNPEDVLAEFGVDSTRLCILSNVSPMSDRNWSKIVYTGVVNWQRKIWGLVSNLRKYRLEGPGNTSDIIDADRDNWEAKIDEARNHVVNNVNFQFERTFHINAGISRLHSYVSWLSKVPREVARSSRAYERAVGDLVVMLGVMAPHFASELWVGLADVAQYDTHSWNDGVLDQTWPSLDDDFMMPLTYKVNGVQISEVGVPFNKFDELDEDSAFSLVCQDPVYRDKFNSLLITSKKFSVNQGHKATLSLRIPDYDFDIKASTTAEKRKQKKKLSKQKKKLHTL